MILYNLRKKLAELSFKNKEQRAELYRISHGGKDKEKLSTSKIALIILSINCFVLEIYAMIMTPILMDSSMIVTIISPLAVEMVGICAYYAKSAKENSVGGITYEKAVREWDENAMG